MTNIEIRVLGPVSVVRGEEAEILRGKAALLVANMVASFPLACSTLALCEALWAAPDDEKTRRLLRAEVSRLRRRIGDSVVFDDSGYRLTIAAETIDVVELATFADHAQELVAKGEFQLALKQLQRASVLNRGEPFANLRDRFSVEAFAAATEELLRSTEEQEVEALLRLQLNERAIVRATDLAANEPFRERRHAQLMMGLARCGRNAEALRHYQTYRSLLGDTTGLEPGNELVKLERAVAQGVVDTEPPSVPSRPIVPAFAPRLPQPASPLVGRTREMTELEVAFDASRLVTLSGPPGIGKTRIAQEYAIETDADPIWIDLASESEQSVLRAIAHASQSWSNDDIVEALVSRLTIDREIGLLVLDNCEHVLGTVSSVVDELLRRTKQLRILVTSRRSIGATHEFVITVGPLPDAETRQLLISRAGTLREVGDHELTRLQELSEGFPLLIGLAAHVIQQTTYDQVDSLGSALLEQGNIRASDLTDGLDESATALFAALGVVRGSFGASAASALSGLDSQTCQRSLNSLIRHSLVDVDRSFKQTRYRLHDVIRVYAHELLQGASGVAKTRTRLAQFMANTTEQRSNDIRTSRARAGLAAATDDLGLTRLSWEQALEDDDAELASRIAVATFELSFRSNHHRDFARSVETLERIDETVLSPAIRVELLGSAGLALWATGRPSLAITTARRSLLVAEELKIAPSFQAMNALAASYTTENRPMDAYQVLVDALTEAKKRADVFFEVGTRSQLAIALAAAGLPDEASKQANRSERRAALSGSPSCNAAALLAQGVAFAETDQDSTILRLKAAIEIAADTGDEWLANWARFWLAQVLATFRPNDDVARPVHKHLLRHWKITHTRPLLNETLASTSILLEAQGENELAERAKRLTRPSELALLLPTASEKIEQIHQGRPERHGQIDDENLASLLALL